MITKCAACLQEHEEPGLCKCAKCGCEMHQLFIRCVVIAGDQQAWCPNCCDNLPGSTLEALFAFISTIEATGGVVLYPNGTHEPVGSEDWVDLGEAYVEACAVLGRKPVIRVEAEA